MSTNANISTPRHRVRKGNRATYNLERQRRYVGGLVVDNLKLYIEMQISGWKVQCTQQEALSGKSQAWEEEKQAYLAHDKISLAEAINHLGADYIIDLTTTIIADDDCESSITVNVPEVPGEIVYSNPIVTKISNWSTIDFEILSTDESVIHKDLDYSAPYAILGAIDARRYIDGSFTSAATVTEAIVNKDCEAIGSFDTYSEECSFTTSSCMQLCKIPPDVLTILAREDKDIEEKCHIARETMACRHFHNVQLPLRTSTYSAYNRQTVVFGNLQHSRGTRFYDHFSKFKQQECRKRPLSDQARHYLSTLSDRNKASRALLLTMQFSSSFSPHGTILHQLGEGLPKHEVFPLRDAL